MLSAFEKKIGDFVISNGLMGPDDRVLLAVSGGADSTALLGVLKVLKDEGIVRAGLFCAHVNHQLRGSASDADEEFVLEQAAQLGLEVKTARVDVRSFARQNRLSIETAARQLRISSLIALAKDQGCNLIATGHQKDDNAETLIQRLSRGTGLRGLAGIRVVQDRREGTRFVRPMLCVRRSEIIDYLHTRHLEWRNDQTNADCRYRRNFIRHRLLPALQEDCCGCLVEQLYELSRAAQRYYELVCHRAERAWRESAAAAAGRIRLDLALLKGEPEPVVVELIRRALGAVGSGERYLRQEHYQSVLRLARGGTSGKVVELPGGYIARYEYGQMVFEQDRREGKPAQDREIVINVPGRTAFGRYLIEATILGAQQVADRSAGKRRTAGPACPPGADGGPIANCIEQFDIEKISGAIVVRQRRPGDRFVPLGLSSEKKVGKFLTGAQVPADLRSKILVVADSEKVIWVWPIRMSEQVKITTETQTVLQLEITDISGKEAAQQEIRER